MRGTTGVASLARARDMLPNSPGIYTIRLALPPAQELGIRSDGTSHTQFEEILNDRLSRIRNAVTYLKAEGTIKEGWAEHVSRRFDVGISSEQLSQNYSQLLLCLGQYSGSLLAAYRLLTDAVDQMMPLYVGRAALQPLWKRLSDHAEERTELISRLAQIGLSEDDVKVHWLAADVGEEGLAALEKLTQLLHYPKLSRS